MKIETCKRCGYKWQPRVKKPKHCSRCKSPYWMKERTRIKRAELEE